MIVESTQIAEALSLSVSELLAQRLAEAGGSAFERELAVAEDTAKVADMCSETASLLEAATASEVEDAAGSLVAKVGAEASTHGAEVSEDAVDAVLDASKSDIASTFAPLRSSKSVYLVTSDGKYKDVTTAWRTMQAEAATSTATAEEWMTAYSRKLATKGVGVQIGDSGVRDIAGAVRSAAIEAKFAASDDAAYAAAASCGMDAVQISAHSGCASDHLPYQGRKYTRAKFDLINASLARPIGRGAMNCRHELMYCYSDSDPMYTESELAALAKASTEEVSFTGASGQTLTKSRYEATQYLRSREVSIRRLKQQSAILDASGCSHAAVDGLIEDQTAAYKRLCRELGENVTESRITAYTLSSLT